MNETVVLTDAETMRLALIMVIGLVLIGGEFAVIWYMDRRDERRERKQLREWLARDRGTNARR